MSKIEFTGTKFSPESFGRTVSPALIKRLLTTEITPTALIPVILLDHLGQQLHSDDIYPRGQAAHADAKAGTDPKDAARAIAFSVKRINQAYYAYYVALLKSMDTLLKSPGVPAKPSGTEQQMESFNKTVVLSNLPAAAYGLGVRSERITLAGSWKGLADPTMEAKEKLKGPKVFWKHTGKASSAFHTAVTARLAQIKAKDFVVGNAKPTPTIQRASASIIGPGKYVVSASYTFKMGVPNWNPEMDTLISIPFATLKSVSTLTDSGLLDRLAADARASGAFDPKANLKTAELTGIDRILMAEAHRPWLRDLSAQAGARLRTFIEGKTIAAAESVVGIKATNSLQNKLLKKKAEAKAVRDEDARKNKARKDAPRLAREAEAKRFAALTPAQQQAERKAVLAAKNEKRTAIRREKALKVRLVADERIIGKANQAAKEKELREAFYGEHGPFYSAGKSDAKPKPVKKVGDKTPDGKGGKSTKRRGAGVSAKDKADKVTKATKANSTDNKPTQVKLTKEERRAEQKIATRNARTQKKVDAYYAEKTQDQRTADQQLSDKIAYRFSKMQQGITLLRKKGKIATADRLQAAYFK